MGVDLLEGLWQYRPETDPAPEPLLCVIPEILLGLAQGPDGETWVAGLPTLRFDPGTLALEFFPKSFYDVVGRGGTTDVVYDATTATPCLVFTARNPTGVWRYDLETREVTPVPVDAGLGNLRRLEIDDAGRLWILADVGIVRFDPASGVTDRFPAPGVDFSFDTVPLGSPSGGGLVAFDLTATGDAVALEESSFIAPPFEVTTLVSLPGFDAATEAMGWWTSCSPHASSPRRRRVPRCRPSSTRSFRATSPRATPPRPSAPTRPSTWPHAASAASSAVP